MMDRPIPVAWKRVAVFASLTLLGFGNAAQADLISRDVNITLNATNIESYDLDVDNNGTVDFTFTAAYAPDPFFSVGFDTIDFPFASSNAAVIDAPTGDGFPTVSRLSLGDTVSSASLFSSFNDQGNLAFFVSFDTPPLTGNFAGQTGYVGLRFDGTGGTFFGFAQVTVNALTDPADPFGLTISTVGYESIAGQPAQVAAASAVPAPASLLLFAGGGAALLAVRRRRAEKSVA